MVALLISGCASLGQPGMPAPPKGQLCSHSVASGRALCADIQSGAPAPSVPISQTNKWVMASPQTWESIQNYIDALILALDENTKGRPVNLSAGDLRQMKRHLLKIRAASQRGK